MLATPRYLKGCVCHLSRVYEQIPNKRTQHEDEFVYRCPLLIHRSRRLQDFEVANTLYSDRMIRVPKIVIYLSTNPVLPHLLHQRVNRFVAQGFAGT